MAKSKNYNVDVNVNVKSKGVKGSVDSAKNLRSALKDVEHQSALVNAAQDKFAKGAAGIGKNSTANFAKISQGMGGLVHVYATVAANVFALGAAYTVLKRNADLTIMQEAANDLAIATGTAFSSIARDMQEITGGAITFTQAMRQANLALSGGATADQVRQITEIANKAANALGYSVPEAVGRMIQAVTKGEPELVDELGIILRITRATEKYAAAHNKAASELTTFEKQQAIINQLIEQGTQKFGEAKVRTNPYEQLAASASELSTNIIKEVSGPLSTVASLIANNMALLYTSIGTIVFLVTKKAIPEVVKLGDTWKTKAAKEAEDAAMEVQKYTDTVEQATKTLRKLKKTSNLSAAGQGFLAEGLIREDLVPNFSDKRTGLYKSLNKVAKTGATGKVIIEELKKAGIDKKIKDLLERGANKAKVITPVEKKILKAHGDELKLLLYHIEEASKELNVVHRKTQAEVQIIRAQKQLYSKQAKATFTQGLGDVFSASTFGDLFSSFKSSIKSLRKAYNPLIQSQDRFNSKLLKGKLLANQIAIGGVGAARGLGLALSKLGPWVAGISIAFEAIKGGLKYFDLVNDALEKQIDKLYTINSEVKEARFNYKDISIELVETPNTLEEVKKKWNKLNGVASQYKGHIKDSLKEAKNIGSQGILDKIFGGHFIDSILGKSPAKVAAQNIKEALKGLSEVTGNTIEISVVIDKDQQKYINKLLKLTRGASLIKRQLGSAISSGVIKITPEMDASTLEKVLTNEKFREAASKQIEEGIKSVVSRLVELQNAGIQASTSVTNLDKLLSDLNNKSASRRNFGTDLAISIRDNLKVTLNSIETFSKEAKSDLVNGGIDATNSAITVYKELPNALKKALQLPTDLVDVDIIRKSMAAAIDQLDKDIDTVRTLKAKLASSASLGKIFQLDKSSGDVSSIISLHKLELRNARERVRAQQAAIRLQISQLALVEKDSAANRETLKAKRAELAYLQAKERQLQKINPYLEVELEMAKRTLDVKSKSLGVEKAKTSVIGNLVSNTISATKNKLFDTTAINSVLPKVKAYVTQITKNIELEKTLVDQKIKEKDLAAEVAINKGKYVNLLVVEAEKEKLLLDYKNSYSNSLQKIVSTYKQLIDLLTQQVNKSIQVREEAQKYSSSVLEHEKAQLNAQIGMLSSIGGHYTAIASLKREVFVQDAKLLQSNLALKDIALFKIDRLIKERQVQSETAYIQDLILRKRAIEAEKTAIQLSLEEARVKTARELIKLNREGQVSFPTGESNSFGNLFSSDSIEYVRQRLHDIAVDMGRSFADTTTNILMGGISSFSGSLVDSLMSNDYKSKYVQENYSGSISESKRKELEAGVSRLEYIIYELKNTLRNSIGQAIKQNITSAIANLLGSNSLLEKTMNSLTAATTRSAGTVVTTTADLVSSITGLVVSIDSLRAAMLSMQASQSSVAVLPSILPSISGSTSTIGNYDFSAGIDPSSIFNLNKYATGGIVNNPEVAIVGEGGQSEAIVPLPNNRNIPVELKNIPESGPTINITQNFDFSGADGNTEEKLRREAARIKQETIKEILSNINRGGAMAKAVGRRR